MFHKQKNRKSLIFRIFLFAFIVYAVVLLVDMQVNVAESRQELLELQHRLDTQITANKDLQRALEKNMDEDEIERIAREKLDFVNPDERVFFDISGR